MKKRKRTTKPTLKLLLEVLDDEWRKTKPDQILKDGERLFLGHSRPARGMILFPAENRAGFPVPCFGVKEVSLRDAICWWSAAYGLKGSGHVGEVFNLAVHQQIQNCIPGLAPLERIFEFSDSGKCEGVGFAGAAIAGGAIVQYDGEGRRVPISLRQALTLWRICDEDSERWPDRGYDPAARAKFLGLVENQLSAVERRAVPGKN